MNISKFFAKTRIMKNQIYKATIGQLKIRYMKCNRILLDRKQWNSIKGQPEFIASIQLSRFINTIRSAQRNYLRIPDNGNLPNTKDRVEQQFVYAAILYEVIQSLSKLFPKIKHLKAWQENTQIIKELNKERSDKNSYYNTVIEAIRNQVAFHFDEIAVSKAVNLLAKKERYLLASSETEYNKDMVFNIVDDLVFNYVISADTSALSEVDKFERILKYVVDISEMIVKLAVDCILEIWKKSAYSERGHLER